MRNACKYLVGALCVLSASKGNAASIYVGTTTPDQVGQQFAYDIREAFAASRQHKLVYSPEDAAFELRVVTLNPEDRQGIQTIYSVTLTLRNPKGSDNFDYYLTSWVGKCGRDVTATCAKSIVSGVDGEVEPIVEALTKALKK